MADFWSLFSEPFAYTFLRRALVASCALSLSAAPLGVILVLRRMSLMGDALSHSVLPGVAVGFFVGGLSLFYMSLGGLIAGLLVAVIAGAISRWTNLEEDASFAGTFLLSLALGVVLVSIKGNNVDLMHFLFGSILAVDDTALLTVAGISTFSLICFVAIYRPLLMECVDPTYFRARGGRGYLAHGMFLICVVANLVAAFQTMGTLMALGMMLLPAIAARFWGRQVWSMIIFSWIIGFKASMLGLLFSYHYDYPSGPATVLAAGIFYTMSLLFGPHGSLLKKIRSNGTKRK